MFKKILFLLVLLILLFPLTYLFSEFYKIIISHPVSSFFWGPDPYLFAGFLMSFLLLLSLFFVAIFKFFIALILIVILNLGVFIFFKGVWFEDLVLLIISVWVGFVIGFIIKSFFNDRREKC
jgi:hypothetical protein